LDEYGHTIVRTPFSQHLWQKWKYSGFPSGNPKKAHHFVAERGAGQGDVGSPIKCDAAFDILLCALSSVKEDRFYAHGTSDMLSPCLDIAYAEDLLSGISTLAGIQEKVNIVSAFTIVFGLDIVTSKLPTFLHSFEFIPRDPLSFTIHISGWIEHPVISTSRMLKVQGMSYDISSSQLHRSQFIITKLKAENTYNIIRRSCGSFSQLRKVVSSGFFAVCNSVIQSMRKTSSWCCSVSILS